MPLRPVRDGLSVANRSRIDDGQRRQLKHAASIVDDVHFRARRTPTNGWRDHMVNAVVPQRPLDGIKRLSGPQRVNGGPHGLMRARRGARLRRARRRTGGARRSRRWRESSGAAAMRAASIAVCAVAMATRRHRFARRSGRGGGQRSGTRRALDSGSVGGGERSMRIHLARRAGAKHAPRVGVTLGTPRP